MSQGRMTRRNFGWVFATAASLPLFGESQTVPALDIDGDGWNSASESMKLGYTMGFTDAANDAHTVVGAESSMCHPPKEQDNKLLAISEKNFDYSNIKFKQLLDGVDIFYGDYRNRAIKWGRALSYVRDTIRGKSGEALERELTFERKWALRDTERK